MTARAPEPLAARAEPVVRGGVPSWEFACAPFRVRFLGRGAPAADDALAARLGGAVDAVAWLRQRHGDRALAARPGLVGEGDALIVAVPRLAAAVAVADCVPLALFGARAAALVHAGWRGIVAGVVPRALERLGEPARTAWIGPAIGPCCYEVGAEVAAAVAGASTERAVVAGRNERPHLDLRRAVAAQLERAGVGEIALLDLCTRCEREHLASFRRDGERAGRNLALVWSEA